MSAGRTDGASEEASPTAGESARTRLVRRLLQLAIPIRIVPYPEHSTVEEGKALRGTMAGTFTKNLLVKDKKGRAFLLSIHEDRQLDLKQLAGRIGAKGHLSFVASDRMVELLGVMPGALTPMALINDGSALVTQVIEAELMSSEQLNFHPLTNTESMGISPADLLRFVRACGREALVVALDGELVADAEG